MAESKYKHLAPHDEFVDWALPRCRLVVEMPMRKEITEQFGFKNYRNTVQRFPEGNHDIARELGLEPIPYSHSQIARLKESFVPGPLIEQFVRTAGARAVANAAIETMSPEELLQLSEHISQRLQAGDRAAQEQPNA